MQFHGVRRGQGGRSVTARGRKAEGAQTGCLTTQSLPDLAHEHGDGGLAVGAGHRRDFARLAFVQGGRHQCQASPRLGVLDQQYGRVVAFDLRAARGQHGDGALGDRLVDKVAAVRLRARQGGEKEAGLDPPAVRGKARNLKSFGRAAHGAVIVLRQKLSEPQRGAP